MRRITALDCTSKQVLRRLGMVSYLRDSSFFLRGDPKNEQVLLYYYYYHYDHDDVCVREDEEGLKRRREIK